MRPTRCGRGGAGRGGASVGFTRTAHLSPRGMVEWGGGCSERLWGLGFSSTPTHSILPAWQDPHLSPHERSSSCKRPLQLRPRALLPPPLPAPAAPAGPQRRGHVQPGVHARVWRGRARRPHAGAALLQHGGAHAARAARSGRKRGRSTGGAGGVGWGGGHERRHESAIQLYSCRMLPGCVLVVALPSSCRGRGRSCAGRADNLPRYAATAAPALLPLVPTYM